MGTRSLTTFIEKWTNNKGKVRQTKIVTMYRQFDGYPSGHGIELANFLAGGKVVNGISANEKGLVFNGIGCLTAQAVAHFKTGPGNIYLHRGGTTNCWEQYRYEVIVDDDRKSLILKCYEVGKRAKLLFEGTPQEFIDKLEEIEAAR